MAGAPPASRRPARRPAASRSSSTPSRTHNSQGTPQSAMNATASAITLSGSVTGPAANAPLKNAAGTPLATNEQQSNVATDPPLLVPNRTQLTARLASASSPHPLRSIDSPRSEPPVRAQP